MNISKTVLTRIKEDKTFRLELAIALNLSERQIQNLAETAERGVSVRLRDYLAVEFYKKKGYTESEIFEKNDIKSLLDTI